MVSKPRKKKSRKVAKAKNRSDRSVLIMPLILVLLIGIYLILSSDIKVDLYEHGKGSPAEDAEKDASSESSAVIETPETPDTSPSESGGGSGGGGSGGGTSSEPGMCGEFTGNEKDWCFRDIAILETDHTICLNIVDEYYKDSCYRYIAINTGDSSYCDYMADHDRRLWCHEVID